MSHLTFPSNTPLMVRNTRGRYKPATADQIMDAARDVIRQLFQPGVKLDTSKVVPSYLRDRLAMLEHEVFAVLFLDAHLRSSNTASCSAARSATRPYTPREVLKEVRQRNAAAVILAHNYPSRWRRNAVIRQCGSAVTKRGRSPHFFSATIALGVIR